MAAPVDGKAEAPQAEVLETQAETSQVEIKETKSEAPHVEIQDTKPEAPHIELQDDSNSPRPDGQASPGLRNSKGWDGKLRVERSAVLANPEILESDPESDDDNVLPGEELPADEGV
jgi:hypothetical protein